MPLSKSSPGSHRKFSWPLALTLIFLIGAIVGTIVFFRLESWPARTARQSADQLERIGRDLRDTLVDLAQLQPRTVVSSRVYLDKTIEAPELAILSRQIEIENELLHTWAGSTKRIKLHGTFLARAGFDLKQSVTVDLGPEQITVRLPHASILGVEQKRIEILAFENGFWNRISASDLEGELSVLPDLAKGKAASSGILPEAEAALEKQLRERVHPDRPLKLIFHDPAPKG